MNTKDIIVTSKLTTTALEQLEISIENKSKDLNKKSNELISKYEKIKKLIGYEGLTYKNSGIINELEGIKNIANSIKENLCMEENSINKRKIISMIIIIDFLPFLLIPIVIFGGKDIINLYLDKVILMYSSIMLGYFSTKVLELINENKKYSIYLSSAIMMLIFILITFGLLYITKQSC